MRLDLVSTDSEKKKKNTGKFHGEFVLTIRAMGQLALPQSWKQRAWFAVCIPLEEIPLCLPLSLPEISYL